MLVILHPTQREPKQKAVKIIEFPIEGNPDLERIVVGFCLSGMDEGRIVRGTKPKLLTIVQITALSLGCQRFLIASLIEQGIVITSFPIR